MSRIIRAVIFDFDGLILDTEVPDFQSWQEVYQEHGCHLPFSTWATCIGSSAELFNPYDYLEEQLGHAVEREKVRSKRRRRYLEMVEAQPILPGVRDYINDAKRLSLKLAVASSATRDWVTGNLSRLSLIEYFDSIRCASDVRQVKPDPELYHSTLEALSIGADEGIVLEDSPNGILAAKRAGLFCVAVPNALTRQLPLDSADLRLDSLADLPLEKLLLYVQGNIGNDKLTSHDLGDETR